MGQISQAQNAILEIAFLSAGLFTDYQFIVGAILKEGLVRSQPYSANATKNILKVAFLRHMSHLWNSHELFWSFTDLMDDCFGRFKLACFEFLNKTIECFLEFQSQYKKSVNKSHAFFH